MAEPKHDVLSFFVVTLDPFRDRRYLLPGCLIGIGHWLARPANRKEFMFDNTDGLFSDGTLRHRVMMVVDLPPNVSKLLGPGLVVSRHRVSFDMSEMLRVPATLETGNEERHQSQAMKRRPSSA